MAPDEKHGRQLLAVAAGEGRLDGNDADADADLPPSPLATTIAVSATSGGGTGSCDNGGAGGGDWSDEGVTAALDRAVSAARDFEGGGGGDGGNPAGSGGDGGASRPAERPLDQRQLQQRLMLAELGAASRRPLRSRQCPSTRTRSRPARPLAASPTRAAAAAAAAAAMPARCSAQSFEDVDDEDDDDSDDGDGGDGAAGAASASWSPSGSASSGGGCREDDCQDDTKALTRCRSRGPLRLSARLQGRSPSPPSPPPPRLRRRDADDASGTRPPPSSARQDRAGRLPASAAPRPLLTMRQQILAALGAMGGTAVHWREVHAHLLLSGWGGGGGGGGGRGGAAGGGGGGGSAENSLLKQLNQVTSDLRCPGLDVMALGGDWLGNRCARRARVAARVADARVVRPSPGVFAMVGLRSALLAAAAIPTAAAPAAAAARTGHSRPPLSSPPPPRQPLVLRSAVLAALAHVAEASPGGRWAPVQASRVLSVLLGWQQRGRGGRVARPLPPAVAALPAALPIHGRCVQDVLQACCFRGAGGSGLAPPVVRQFGERHYALLRPVAAAPPGTMAAAAVTAAASPAAGFAAAAAAARANAVSRAPARERALRRPASASAAAAPQWQGAAAAAAGAKRGRATAGLEDEDEEDDLRAGPRARCKGERD